MATDFDPYRILGLDPSAPPALVEAAYQQMRLRYGEEPERLQEVEAAYRMLIDPEQRQAYAIRRAATLTPLPADADIDAALARVGQTQAPSAPPTVVEPAPWNYWDMAKAIGIVIAGTLIASVPAALLADSLLESGQDFEDDPVALTIILSVSLVLELLLLGTAYWFGPRKYRLRLSALGLRWPTRDGLGFRIWFPMALAFAALGVVAAYFAVLKLAGVEPDADVPEEVFDNPGPLIVVVILSMVFAPLMEEIFFRGFIFGGLRGRWGWVGAGVASGVLFGFAHVANPGALYVVPPIAGIGFLFAWAYRYSGSIISSIIAHCIYNSISVIASLATSVLWLCV